AIFLTAIDPVVNGAALHQNIAGLELYRHAVVKLHIDRAGDDDGIVDRIGAMIAWSDARPIAHDTEHGAIFDRGFKCAGRWVMKAVVVDRKALGRPDHTRVGAGPV